MEPVSEQVHPPNCTPQVPLGSKSKVHNFDGMYVCYRLNFISGYFFN